MTNAELAEYRALLIAQEALAAERSRGLVGRLSDLVRPRRTGDAPEAAQGRFTVAPKPEPPTFCEPLSLAAPNIAPGAVEFGPMQTVEFDPRRDRFGQRDDEITLEISAAIAPEPVVEPEPLVLETAQVIAEAAAPPVAQDIAPPPKRGLFGQRDEEPLALDKLEPMDIEPGPMCAGPSGPDLYDFEDEPMAEDLSEIVGAPALMTPAPTDPLALVAAVEASLDGGAISGDEAISKDEESLDAEWADAMQVAIAADQVEPPPPMPAPEAANDTAEQGQLSDARALLMHLERTLCAEMMALELQTAKLAA